MESKKNTFMGDLAASVVVFLVALPLCLGIAIASGMPPATGLITGIIGGIVVGALGGAPLQVSGPAAGLAVIVYELVQRHGIEKLGVVVLAAGTLQLAAGLLRWGHWFRAMSPAVIYGMLAGIGVLIFSSQFHVMVDDLPRKKGWQNLLSIPEAIYKGIFPMDGSAHHIAAVLGLVTIVSLLAWNRFRPQKLQMLPGALIGVMTASALALFLQLPVKFVDIPSRLLDSVQWPTLAGLRSLGQPELAVAALGLAFIASAETLLSTSAVDRMHSGPRANYDRELAVQGVGNMLAGLLGALPMTGVIVRSAANVEAGAKTRWSAILHGAFLLAAVFLVPDALRNIPTSSLGAILVYTGYKLIKPEKIKELAGYGKMELVVYGATVLGIVIFDLLTGVLLGIALALIGLLYRLSHVVVYVEQRQDGACVDLHLEGAATFLGLPRLADTLERIPQGTEVHVHFNKLEFIDHACLDLLSSWEKQREMVGNRMVLEWEELTRRFHERGQGLATRLHASDVSPSVSQDRTSLLPQRGIGAGKVD